MVLLVLDPSRIARDPMLGLYVAREAEKHGVVIEYAKMPVDGASAFGETMLAVVRAVEQLLYIKRARIYQLIAAGRFPVQVRFPSGSVRWRRTDLDRWIEGGA